MKPEQSMTILMLDRYLTIGGVATYLKTLCLGMIEKGHTVYIMTAADDDNRKLLDEFTSCGIHILTLPNTEKRGVVAYRFIKNSYQFLKRQTVDIIHSHHRLVNFAGILINKIFPIPHLLTLHVFKDNHKLLSHIFKNEWITVPSKALKNHLVHHYHLKEDHIQVIYNSISSDLEIDKKKMALLQKTVFNDPAKFYAGYIGRISQEKGIDILIESIPLVKKQCPDVEFRIFGDGSQLAELKVRCNELNLDDEKIFPGPTKYVNEALSLMDIGIIPSRSESFSLFALECMRARKLVIASNVGGIPEVVTHTKTGFLIEKEDPEVLAESIIKLYGDKKLREHLAGQGYQRFKENFLLEKFYSDYEGQYRNLISTPKISYA